MLLRTGDGPRSGGGGFMRRFALATNLQRIASRRMNRLNGLFVLLWCTSVLSGHAERINHAGRLLGSAPVLTNAVLFNTPDADAIVAAMQIFPVDSAWNEDISRRPVLPNSDAIIGLISSDLSPTRRTLRAFEEMNFALVPDSQPPVPIRFTLYGNESD